MSEKRRGLGRGLGALIPSSGASNGQGNGAAASRPVDLFFPEGRKKSEPVEAEGTGKPDGPSAAAPSEPAPASKKVAPAKTPVPRKSTSTARTAGSTTKKAKEVAGAAADADDTATTAGKGQATPAPAAPAGSTGFGGTSSPSSSDGSPSAEVAGLGASDNGADLVEVPGAHFAEISVTDIHPNRKQPRSVFDEDDMAELVHSVREIGVLQPIVVRKSTEDGVEPYELVMGERRWRAVQAAGLDTVPAIVRETTDDDLLRDALLENLHRSQLNPLEEAAAYQQLLEDFGTTHEQLADRIGRSRPQVSNTLRLLKLPPLVQRRVAAGVLSAGHARALLALPDAAAMERLAQKIVAEGMSVRATEEAVTLYQDPATPAKNNVPRPGARHERLDYLASSLSDRLDTNVKISLGVRKGKVSIEFASVEDLNRIMDVLAPDSAN
ncbi:parB-like partition protein [Pseudarthrobacter chlorophenolicus A6]|uniref:ParB-like partition protein n=1 Tax=Pseudarthrobacter chlorophenolicus (strain ATCC 700700 / DSM 12829 / CIP 107037 / JCM 12360 / KCTC 9906 / NCIMB 13794 / A6) TaxID=452863 RepID=B8H8Y7_PSECP|nr:ParB/RepB/Spo0J family partition protein [Pseudarthrobacter chlorophenolicus]ACL41882.1 parB-like partition protein [Pseudarthrobacter chlorophenolicus A6]